MNYVLLITALIPVLLGAFLCVEAARRKHEDYVFVTLMLTGSFHCIVGLLVALKGVSS